MTSFTSVLSSMTNATLGATATATATTTTNDGQQMVGETNLTTAASLPEETRSELNETTRRIAQFFSHQKADQASLIGPPFGGHLQAGPAAAARPLELGPSELILVVVLISIIIISIVGNCLVCIAIFTDRRLRKLGNAFIVSLAVADLFVSCLVMTFALFNDLMNYWMFGDWFCDIWISFDVMCCTASILNLCAISLDRFIHIKDCLLYNQWMTRRVALGAVIIIWFISALVSFVPITLGWHKPPDNQALLRLQLQQQQQQQQPLNIGMAHNLRQISINKEGGGGGDATFGEEARYEERGERRPRQAAHDGHAQGKRAESNRDVLKDYFATGDRLLAKGVNSMNGRAEGGETTIRQTTGERPWWAQDADGQRHWPVASGQDESKGRGASKLNYFFQTGLGRQAIENRLAEWANRRQIKEVADFVSSEPANSSAPSLAPPLRALSAELEALHRRRRQTANAAAAAAAAEAATSGEHEDEQEEQVAAGGQIRAAEEQQLAQCMLTLTPTYAVVSSTISFYIPCIIMLGLYSKLFACARRHVRNIRAISRAVPAPTTPLAVAQQQQPQQRAVCPAASVASAPLGDASSNNATNSRKNSTNGHSIVGQTNKNARQDDCSLATTTGQLQTINDTENAQTGASQVPHVSLSISAEQQPSLARQKRPGLLGPARTWIKFGRRKARGEAASASQLPAGFCDKAIGGVATAAAATAAAEPNQDAESEPFLGKRRPLAQSQTSASLKSVPGGGGLSASMTNSSSGADRVRTSSSTKSATSGTGIRFNLVAAVSGGAGSWKLNSQRSASAQNVSNAQQLQRTNHRCDQQVSVQQQYQNNKQTTSQLATHKAAITLGIIMGTFLFCWVPFFCLNIIRAFCVDCIPSSVFRAFTWLGYANSALNPIIYGIHNSEFRNAFNRIFFKHLTLKNGRQYLSRRFSYDLRNHHQANHHVPHLQQQQHQHQQQASYRPHHQCQQLSVEP